VSDDSLWIFGYGSLVWRPAFPHRRRAPASISGYVRRFWQGSTDHRGVPGRPGRVVTLLPADHHSVRAETGDGGAPGAIPSAEADGWPGDPTCPGTAYEVGPEDSAQVLRSLDHRERAGYERIELDLEIRSESGGSEIRRGLVYIAGPRNESYLGPAPLAEIALQIASAVGPSGANPEYVFELARSLREMGAHDPHVFAVEAAVARASRRASQGASQSERSRR